jgi:hypothetical protein
VFRPSKKYPSRETVPLTFLNGWRKQEDDESYGDGQIINV